MAHAKQSHPYFYLFIPQIQNCFFIYVSQRMSTDRNDYVRQWEGEGEWKSKRTSYAVTVEIEHCSNCEAHSIQNKHSSLKYKSEYEQVKRKLQQHGISVKKRQLPNNLYKKSPYSPPNIYINIDTNQQVCFPYIGAFQVYYNNQKIFSKIQTKQFPNIHTLLPLIYRLALKNNNFYYHDKGFLGKKKKSHKEKIIQSLMEKQQQFLSSDFEKLESSKKKYLQFKERFEEKRRRLSNYGQQIRPNTTNLARTIDRGTQVKSGREFYSRGHEKTNEEVLNTNNNKQLQASIKIRRINNIVRSKQGTSNQTDSKSKQPHFIRYPPKRGQDKYEQYNVYLQSLSPRKKSKDPQLQSHRMRLRKKIEEYKFRYHNQIKDIKEIKVNKVQEENNIEIQQKLIFAQLLQNMNS